MKKDSNIMYASYENYNKEQDEKEKEQPSIPRISFDITDVENFYKAKEMYEVIVVDAWAPWCTPCKKAGERLEELGHRYLDFVKMNRLLFLKDNIDNEESPHKKDVNVVPTFFVYVRGKLHQVYTGVEFPEFEEFLNHYFTTYPTLFKN